MKYLTLLLTIYLITLSCKAQDSISTYLNTVRQDFLASEQVMPDSIVNNYDIVFIGETHGFSDNYKIASKFIKEYKRHTGFTYLLAEMDWATSQKLNSYILTEDTVEIKKLIDKTKSSPAWCKERYLLYKELIEINNNHEKKIMYLGVDIPAGGISNTISRIIEINSKYGNNDTKLRSFAKIQIPNKEVLDYLEKIYKDSDSFEYQQDDLFEYKFHLQNIFNYNLAIHTSSNIGWDKVRDSCIFENYKKLESQLNLQNEKMIGVWGHTHTLQSESDGVKWFASSLKNQMNKKVYSYRIFYFDSKCMLPEHWLPGILKITKSKKKQYYNVKLQNDDNWVTGQKKEIGKLKKATPKESIYFYDLTSYNSPFKNNPYLVVKYGLDWNTTDFFQTAIVVRNSKPTEPFGENRR